MKVTYKEVLVYYSSNNILGTNKVNIWIEEIGKVCEILWNMRKECNSLYN